MSSDQICLLFSGYGFNQWNRDREIDGFLCRTTDDCSWLDRRLYCQDYELDFTPSVSQIYLQSVPKPLCNSK